MNIHEVRDLIRTGSLSEKSIQTIDAILDAAERNGDLTEEDKAKIMEIIDLEIAVSNLEVEIIEAEAQALAKAEEESRDVYDAFVLDVEKINAELQEELRKLQ
jgi:hypothetical protein